ncbi:MAG: hypothetical protein ACOYT8_03765 [Candidatus Dependentiae bacterium]
MTPKLVVPFNKKVFERALRLIPLQFLMWLLFFFFLKSSGWQLILKYLVGLSIALAIPSVIYMYKLFKSDEPAAVLSENGLWARGYGTIPWSNITEFYMPLVMGYPTETIVVELKDKTPVFAQAGFYEKINFLWAKIFRYAPVRLSYLDLPCQTIVDFAQQFLEK